MAASQDVLPQEAPFPVSAKERVVLKTVFALIGAGNLAQAQHLPNLAWAPHAELRTVCDLREDLAKAAQEKYAIPACETDFKKVLRDTDIDAVVIAVQAELHADLTMAALKAGKHVYVEKPLAESLEKCRAIVQLQQKHGKSVAVGFNRRFAPAYRKVKQLLHSHGGAWNVYYRITDTYSYEWGKDFPPGARLFHEICHIFDFFRWLFDANPVSVYCVNARNDDEMIVLKFETGPVATIMSSGYATADMPKESLEIIAEKGGLTVDNFVELRTYGWADAKMRYLFPGRVHPDRDYTYRWLYGSVGADAMRAVRANAYWLRFLHEHGASPSDDPVEQAIAREYLEKHAPHVNYDVDKGWLQAIDHFAESLAMGTDPENASAHDGLWAAHICEAAAHSRETGQTIDIQPI